MTEVLLALVLVSQLVLIGMVWIGTNIQDRLWQIPVVGRLLDRREGLRAMWEQRASRRHPGTGEG